MIHDYGQHFIFPGCNDDTTVKNIMAQVEDLSDQAIYNAIIKAAQEAGVTDLYLMDKTFVLDALREKLERENQKPLTIEELRQMNGKPVWIVWSDNRIKSQWWIPGDYSWYVMEFDDPIMERRYGEKWIAYRHKPKEVVE